MFVSKDNYEKLVKFLCLINRVQQLEKFVKRLNALHNQINKKKFPDYNSNRDNYHATYHKE